MRIEGGRQAAKSTLAATGGLLVCMQQGAPMLAATGTLGLANRLQTCSKQAANMRRTGCKQAPPNRRQLSRAKATSHSLLSVIVCYDCIFFDLSRIVGGGAADGIQRLYTEEAAAGEHCTGAGVGCRQACVARGCRQLTGVGNCSQAAHRLHTPCTQTKAATSDHLWLHRGARLLCRCVHTASRAGRPGGHSRQ